MKLHRDSLLLFASALSLSLGLEEPHPLSELQGVPLNSTFYYHELNPRIISLITGALSTPSFNTGTFNPKIIVANFMFEAFMSVGVEISLVEA